jgi:streptogramin lyase
MLNVGAPVPPDQVAVLTEYLVKNFLEKPKPAPSLISGDARVEIREWLVPMPGARPHDPLAYPDGSIWYTDHMANVLGRLDPRTGPRGEPRRTGGSEIARTGARNGGHDATRARMLGFCQLLQ